MEREQFTFYRSFLAGISRIKNKTARCEAYDSIVLYALNGEEPDLEKLSDMAALAFVMAKPNIDASRKKAESGRLGGTSKGEANGKQTGSKPEANDKQPESKEEESKPEARAAEANPKQEKEQGQEQGQDKEQMLYARERAGASRIVFRVPTVEEVSAYCAERRNRVDPAAFVDFYSSKGWKVGSSPMKDWKAAVRTWEQRDGRGPGTADKPQTHNPFLAMAMEMEE